jgi:hypothetical protein
MSKAALSVQRGQGGLLVSGVLKMKRSFEILIKLGTCLAACVGCSSKTPPCPAAPEKPQSHIVRWKAADSDYEGTTTVQPTDAASSTGKK